MFVSALPLSLLGGAAAAISVSVSARREINSPLCGGRGGGLGVSAGGARVEMGRERGVCRGISLLSVSVFFFPVLFSIVGGQLTNLTILLHQLNINLKLDCCPLSLSPSLWVYLYGCWLGDTEQG